MTTVEIPSALMEAAKLKPEDVKVELAIQLFQQGLLTAHQTRTLAGGSIRLDEMFLKRDKSGRIDMDVFIDWAAHDLKSPLNSIVGFTRVVLKGIDGPVNELQTTDLNAAYSNGLRISTLINNLIDMARLNIGELKFSLTSGDLVQNLVDAANRWKTQNPLKELETEINIDSPVITFDRVHLRQAVTGLLTYAAYHVADGGKIVLRVQDDSHNVLFEITSAGEKPREKFEMDLAMQAFICTGLISLHGGSLNIGADTGTGVTLSFSIPRI